MFSLAATAQGLQQLSQLFSTCQPLQDASDVNLLAALYINAWDTLAMGNFPYPSNYLSGSVDLPPWPFRCTSRSASCATRCSQGVCSVACDFLKDPSLPARPIDLLQAFVSAAGIFNNCTKDVQARVKRNKTKAQNTDTCFQCYSLPQSDPFFDGQQWDYQWCTQLLPEELFFPTRGDVDMFFPRDFMSKDFLLKHCGTKYGVAPRRDWIPTSYGGAAYPGTNVVFSNGLLDPWSSAGLLTATHPSVTIAVMPEGAHHLDLFFSNESDPDSVRAARSMEIAAIRLWLQQ
jgi:lysosomal Pro-X carboxypeptidase